LENFGSVTDDCKKRSHREPAIVKKERLDCCRLKKKSGAVAEVLKKKSGTRAEDSKKSADQLLQILKKVQPRPLSP